MPPIEAHIEKSIKRTGKDYRKIHEWIDNPEKKLERHDLGRLLEFAKMFEEKYGEEGAREYVQHLQDDLSSRFGHLLEDVEKLVAENLKYFGCN